MSLNEKAAVFRLESKIHKNLQTHEYADNRMQYLEDTKNVGNLTVDDLNSALMGL